MRRTVHGDMERRTEQDKRRGREAERLHFGPDGVRADRKSRARVSGLRSGAMVD